MINRSNVKLIIIIGFSGKNGVGKSTIRQGVFNKLTLGDLDSHKLMISFADKVKLCAYKYFRWDSKKDLRGRKLLQHIGTLIGRLYDENCWIKHTLDTINRCIGTLQPTTTLIVLIDDVRFLNLAKWVGDNGGILVNLTRSVETQCPGHASLLGFPSSYYNMLFNLDGKKIQLNVLIISDQVLMRV